MLDTNQKILLAKWLSAIVRAPRAVLGLPSTVRARRRGIDWELDLKEGIDLAIYLLGGFEVRTLDRYKTLVREGDVVFDIGANIGAHTLPLAALVGDAGIVHAFEPTDYAYGKLRSNIALNPRLAGRIDAHQAMLMDREDSSVPESVYSSWPLEAAPDLHAEHSGRLMTTIGARPMTLDGAVAALKLSRVDFIKLDVDGNEASVLGGATQTLERFRPTMLMELAPYVYRERMQVFDDMLRRLFGAGYELSEADSGKRLVADCEVIRAAIPKAGGMNVVARPGALAR